MEIERVADEGGTVTMIDYGGWTSPEYRALDRNA